MKKGLIILFLCFILAGCNNKLSLDFNDKIDAKIEFSFTEEEYANKDDIDASMMIEAIISEARPLNDSYEELFNEVSYSAENGNYKGEYTYTYTYDNFDDNALLDRCFEYAAVEENDDSLYIYLKGQSECAPFDLRVKADDRMLENNATLKEDNEYVWKVSETGNVIYFKISKEKVENKVLSTGSIIYIVLLIPIILGVIYLKKKFNNK